MIWSLNKFQSNASWVFCLSASKRILIKKKQEGRRDDPVTKSPCSANMRTGVSICRAHVKSWAWLHRAINSALGGGGEWRQVDLWSLPTSQSSQNGSVRTCLNVKRQMMEGDTPHPALVSTCLHTGMNLHIHMYVCTTHTSHRNERDSEQPKG